jgi:hypothetical protein
MNMSGKRVPEHYEVLMANAPARPARKTSSEQQQHVRKIAKTNSESTNSETIDEVKNHRQAIQEYRDTCDVTRPWVSAVAVLYLAHGDKIMERHALWIFPNANERYLIASSSPSHDGNHVEEYYILVRFEGKNSLDKLSLGICKSGNNEYTASSSTEDAPLELDPTEGHVIRILSVERDGEPLQQPEHASPLLQNAKHLREVVRKHAGKIAQVSETLHYKFGVLRTTEYLEAKDMLQSDDCGPEEWHASLETRQQSGTIGTHDKTSLGRVTIIAKWQNAYHRKHLACRRNAAPGVVRICRRSTMGGAKEYQGKWEYSSCQNVGTRRHAEPSRQGRVLTRADGVNEWRKKLFLSLNGNRTDVFSELIVSFFFYHNKLQLL